MASASHYEVLGVAADASPKAIKDAYRKLSRDLHPDRNHDPSATARMAEVNRAYAVLSDPEKRARYDKYMGRDMPPIEKAASEALTTIIGNVIESEATDILHTTIAQIEETRRRLQRNRAEAQADIARLTRRRTLLRRKDGKEEGLVAKLFDSKIQRAKDALVQMAFQEDVMDEMLRMLEEYESTVDEPAPTTQQRWFSVDLHPVFREL